jgi:alcohol dehydrogenase (cytochrome c)/quinohemoprotein ethanol dehydrogenase
MQIYAVLVQILMQMRKSKRSFYSGPKYCLVPLHGGICIHGLKFRDDAGERFDPLKFEVEENSMKTRRAGNAVKNVLTSTMISLYGILLSGILLSACGRQDAPNSQDAEAGAQEEAGRAAPGWVDAERVAKADSEPENWLLHGRTTSEQRYSPLNQINESNIGQLGLAWYFDLDTSRGQQASPIIVDGLMYTTSAWSKVQALDAVSGELKWQFDPKISKEWDVKSCCGVQNRGAAVWRGRVYVGTIDGRLIALDAATGKVDWEVQTTDPSGNYSITGAPRIAKGKVIIGNGGAEYLVRGYVTAYDAETGEQAWRFYVVPGNPADGFESDAMEMAAATWTGEWWKLGGGGTAWDSFAYDPDLDLFYIGTGNGSPWSRTLRSPGGGDNLFLASIVAVRPDTGEYVWHYQTVPGDTWDYTAVQHMILAELMIGGRERKVIMQAPKNGFFYVLDRETGELLLAEKIMPANWASHIDIETGRPVETPDARYDETGVAKKITPGPDGSHNWHPMSYSPDTGLVYIPAQQIPMVYRLDENFSVQPIGVNLGVNYWDPQDEFTELPAGFGPEFQGHLLAWNPVTRQEAWRVTHTTFYNGGVLSTAGNLVFQGNTDEELVAYNALSGERLWSAPTQTGVIAPPVSFSVNGEQYIALVAGWGGAAPLIMGPEINPDSTMRNISRVLAFKLGANLQLPPLPPRSARISPPEDIGSEAQILAGSSLYERNCAGCHGITAVSGGVLPDLRHSAITTDAAAWRSIVRDGSRQDKGMVSFAAVLSEDEAEAIRMFVIRRANEPVKK